MKDLLIIEIGWNGPYDLTQVSKLNTNSDYGLYQIYGTHNIFGANTLLYIGKARDETFAQRFVDHSKWIDDEANDAQVYIGKLGSTLPITDKEWGQHIDYAEKLLIYFSAPPYNSQNIKDYGYKKISNVIVLNLGKKNMLPFEVSTLYDESKFWDRAQWKFYEYNEQLLKEGI